MYFKAIAYLIITYILAHERDSKRIKHQHYNKKLHNTGRSSVFGNTLVGTWHVLKHKEEYARIGRTCRGSIIAACGHSWTTFYFLPGTFDSGDIIYETSEHLFFIFFFNLMFGFAFFPSLISLRKTLPYCFLMIIAFFPFKDFPYSSWQVNLAAIRSYLVNCRGGSLALEPAKYVSYSTLYKAHLLTRNDLTINHYNGIEYHN